MIYSVVVTAFVLVAPVAPVEHKDLPARQIGLTSLGIAFLAE